MKQEKKVALVHYWLVGMRGGEKVLEALCELYPTADIYTLVLDESKISPTIRRHKITTSFLQRIGGVKRYQMMLPLMPFALESFDLTGYDLVISSEAGPAKAIVTNPDAVHVCYCHSPMRYIWDLEPQYRAEASWIAKILLTLVGPFLRQWDVTTSARVDYFIANSHYVAKRIRKFYRRAAVIAYPPVSLERFSPVVEVTEVYICAGQITPYKKIELAIQSFNQMGKRLDIIGSGVTENLRKLAGPTIRFLGAVSDTVMAECFAKCKALVYPGVEDFGIVPLEVMASGRPVIAYARGGALETVLPGVTGVFFYEQTKDALIEAVEKFERCGVTGTYEDFKKHTEAFSLNNFKLRFLDCIDDACASSRTAARQPSI